MKRILFLVAISIVVACRSKVPSELPRQTAINSKVESADTIDSIAIDSVEPTDSVEIEATPVKKGPRWYGDMSTYIGDQIDENFFSLPDPQYPTVKYKIRDGLTPKVMIREMRKRESRDSLPDSWFGFLYVFYGHFSSASATEAIAISYEGSKCHADGYTHVYLFRKTDSRWRAVSLLSDADFTAIDTIDLNNDSTPELFLNHFGGNGYGYNAGSLLSFRNGKCDTLYSFTSYENWCENKPDDFKDRRYWIDFDFSTPVNGWPTLREHQLLFIQKESCKYEDYQYLKAGKYRLKAGDTLTIRTKYTYQNGKYRKSSSPDSSLSIPRKPQLRPRHVSKVDTLEPLTNREQKVQQEIDTSSLTRTDTIQ